MRFLTLVVGLLQGLPAQQPVRCEPPDAEQAAGAVRDLNEQYIAAARTNDAAWFAGHLADDVVVVLGSGVRLRKTEFLTRLRDTPSQFRILEVRDVTVRVFGTIVQVDADAPWQLADGRRGVSRYIDTYAWLDCRWQVISAQVTTLPQPEPPWR